VRSDQILGVYGMLYVTRKLSVSLCVFVPFSTFAENIGAGEQAAFIDQPYHIRVYETDGSTSHKIF
jgi:hypothetical protein